MHFYMVLTSNPQAYAKAKGNPYWKIAMKEGDFDLLPSNQRKWIDMDISLVHLLHHIYRNIYIFIKTSTKKKFEALCGLLGVKNTTT